MNMQSSAAKFHRKNKRFTFPLTFTPRKLSLALTAALGTLALGSGLSSPALAAGSLNWLG